MSRLGREADMHEIRPGLWLGSVEAASNRKALQARGITHVLTLGEGLGEHMGVQGAGPESTWASKRKRLAPAAGDPFERLMVSILDGPEEPLSRHFRPSSDFIAEALSRGAKGGVLVHCHAGISRGATTVAQHLMRTEGLTAAQSLSSIRAAGRTFINPNEGFLGQLRQLEAELPRSKPAGRRGELSYTSSDLGSTLLASPVLRPRIEERERDFYSRLESMQSRLKDLQDVRPGGIPARALRSVSPVRSARHSDDISDRLRVSAARGYDSVLNKHAGLFPRPLAWEERPLAERWATARPEHERFARNLSPPSYWASRDLLFDSALRHATPADDPLWRRSAWRYSGQSMLAVR